MAESVVHSLQFENKKNATYNFYMNFLPTSYFLLPTFLYFPSKNF